jgi:hypothetical protein
MIPRKRAAVVDLRRSRPASLLTTRPVALVVQPLRRKALKLGAAKL